MTRTSSTISTNYTEMREGVDNLICNFSFYEIRLLVQCIKNLSNLNVCINLCLVEGLYPSDVILYI